MNENKIAILTWHYYNNFGSALQAYALQETIKNLDSNVDVEILNYQSKLYSSKLIIRIIKKIDILYFFLCILLKKGRSYKFYRFRKKYLNETKLYLKEKKIQKNIDAYKSIIVGSDQIWAPNVFNPIYMLNFVSNKKIKKISYAASIGLDEIPNELIPKYKELLSDFAFISVREYCGQQLLKENCKIDSTIVLDPTLLINIEKYKKIMKPCKFLIEKYIFCYFLNEDNKYKEQVEEYAIKCGLKIFGISTNPKDKKWMNTLSAISPQEFLWIVANATAIFTDSYHGIIFSLLFHKEFFAFERFSKDNPICQNSRINQLCLTFNISERLLINKKNPLQCKQYNYEFFEEKLDEERKKSINFLIMALK